MLSRKHKKSPASVSSCRSSQLLEDARLAFVVASRGGRFFHKGPCLAVRGHQAGCNGSCVWYWPAAFSSQACSKAWCRVSRPVARRSTGQHGQPRREHEIESVAATAQAAHGLSMDQIIRVASSRLALSLSGQGIQLQVEKQTD